MADTLTHPSASTGLPLHQQTWITTITVRRPITPMLLNSTHTTIRQHIIIHQRIPMVMLINFNTTITNRTQHLQSMHRQRTVIWTFHQHTTVPIIEPIGRWVPICHQGKLTPSSFNSWSKSLCYDRKHSTSQQPSTASLAPPTPGPPGTPAVFDTTTVVSPQVR